jgi:hypothetical protein
MSRGLPTNGNARCGQAFALAHLAAHANRRRDGWIIQIHSPRVHRPLRVADVAAQRNRKRLARCTVAALSHGHGASDPQIRAAVRHAGQLRQNLARLRERLVHVPQRARATDLGEVEMGGRLAFGNVAGAVHANEKEGHAWRAGPLQRAQAVADGLESHTEAARQQIDVVAQILRGLQERLVREQKRTGEVIGQANAGQGAGLRIVLETGCLDQARPTAPNARAKRAAWPVERQAGLCSRHRNTSGPCCPAHSCVGWHPLRQVDGMARTPCFSARRCISQSDMRPPPACAWTAS